MTTAATALDPRVWTDDMGELSGIGADNPGYEADCRRMIMAGAEWLEAHPNAEIAITKAMGDLVVIAAWERVYSGDTPHGHELLQVLHRACCADRGDRRGPTALQMGAAIELLRFIEAYGWDTFVRRRRAMMRGGVL
jgi:hypothetical protein